MRKVVVAGIALLTVCVAVLVAGRSGGAPRPNSERPSDHAPREDPRPTLATRPDPLAAPLLEQSGRPPAGEERSSAPRTNLGRFVSVRIQSPKGQTRGYRTIQPLVRDNDGVLVVSSLTAFKEKDGTVRVPASWLASADAFLLESFWALPRVLKPEELASLETPVVMTQGPRVVVSLDPPQAEVGKKWTTVRAYGISEVTRISGHAVRTGTFDDAWFMTEGATAPFTLTTDESLDVTVWRHDVVCVPKYIRIPGPGGQAKFRFEPASFIELRLINAHSGAPIHGPTWVTMHEEPLGRPVREGRTFKLTEGPGVVPDNRLGLHPGRYRLVTTSPGFEPRQAVVEIEDYGQRLALEQSLTPLERGGGIRLLDSQIAEAAASEECVIAVFVRRLGSSTWERVDPKHNLTVGARVSRLYGVPVGTFDLLFAMYAPGQVPEIAMLRDVNRTDGQWVERRLERKDARFISLHKHAQGAAMVMAADLVHAEWGNLPVARTYASSWSELDDGELPRPDQRIGPYPRDALRLTIRTSGEDASRTIEIPTAEQ